MKSYSVFLLSLAFMLSSFTSKTNFDSKTELLLSVKKITKETSVNILFFTDGSCSVQTLENGQQTSSKSIVLPESELKSLKKIVKKVRPIELRSTYTCAEKKVDKTGATVYSFAESKKVVVVNNKCTTVSRLKDLRGFITNFMEKNS